MIIYKSTSGRWSDGKPGVIPYIWNTSSLAWEAATGSLTGSGNVTVNNFPASYPVTIAPLATWVSGSLTLTNATTAYLIPASEQVGRRTLILYNGSDTSMFIGASTVTVATGILLVAGGTMTIDAGAGLYAICASAGKILNYLEGK